MAKKTTTISKSIAPSSKKATSKAAVSTPVRNTAIPKTAARKPVEITGEMIAVRAYEIHTSGKGGTETENWFAAEKQLRSGV